MLRVCMSVSKQHTSQCRLSLPHAGAHRSSRLWEERADSQTVSRVQRILYLWVSLKTSAHIVSELVPISSACFVIHLKLQKYYELNI